MEPHLLPGGPVVERHVRFRLGGEICAIPMTLVREVLRPAPLTRVPRVPAHILGVMNLRGRIVPVVDLRLRLGLEAAGSGKPRVLVAQVRDITVGFLVCEVIDSQSFTPGEITDPPDVAGPIPLDLVRGLVPGDEEVTVLFDLETLLEADRRQLAGRHERGSPRAGPR